MSKHVTTNTPAPAAAGADNHPPLVLDLPPALSAIIKEGYDQLLGEQHRLQEGYEQRTRLLLQGFLSAVPGVADKNFDLSEDKTMLVERV